MTPDQLTTAIVNGINSGGEGFLEGTLAAVLPIIWLAIIALHVGRPYILEMIDRFTLRLGADLLWLIYVALRDFLFVTGVVMSFMFFFPDVLEADALPLTGGLAAVCLFAALLVKLMGDPDNNLRDFRIVSGLLGLGAIFYFLPYVFGVQAVAGQFTNISNFLVTSTNTAWAIPIAYVSIVLLAILGAIATAYTLKTGGRPEVAETTSSTSK